MFNEINQLGVLWTVRHLWPSGARFSFNCYRHWSSLVLRNWNCTASFLHSREVLTQGDPLAIITYGISILPFIKNLKREIPDVPQPWYDDNSGSLGTFAILETYFYSLTHQGPVRGYIPKPSKSVLIVCQDNIEARKVFGACHKFKVCTGTRYLGGCIRENRSKRDWLREHTLAGGGRTSAQLAKLQGNIPRRVTPQWYVQSNYSGYFYNASPGTLETRSWD